MMVSFKTFIAGNKPEYEVRSFFLAQKRDTRDNAQEKEMIFTVHFERIRLQICHCSPESEFMCWHVQIQLGWLILIHHCFKSVYKLKILVIELLRIATSFKLRTMKWHQNTKQCLYIVQDNQNPAERF